jgi:hypothetical protein
MDLASGAEDVSARAADTMERAGGRSREIGRKVREATSAWEAYLPRFLSD